MSRIQIPLPINPDIQYMFLVNECFYLKFSNEPVFLSLDRDYFPHIYIHTLPCKITHVWCGSGYDA